MLHQFQFSVSEVKAWLEKETNPTLFPIQTQAQKHIANMHIGLQNLLDASKMLLDNSQSEIDRRNMKVYNRARALNKLALLFIERIKKLKTPEDISYENLNSFAQDIQKALAVTEIDIKNWFQHISPFFIMDRRKFLSVYEKTKLIFGDFNNFLTRDYIKTKGLQQTFQLIDELEALEKQLTLAEGQKTNLKNERLSLGQEIATIEQQIHSFATQINLYQLTQTNAEIESLNNMLKQELRHLQKPFIKMQALSVGGSGLTSNELKRVALYLENPFEAIITEEVGLPALKELLQKLLSLLRQDALRLKSDKARKAEQAITEILKHDSLEILHRKCVEVATRKRQLERSTALEEAQRQLSLLQQQKDQLQARCVNLETDEVAKEKTCIDLREKVRSYKKAIETNILNYLGKQVQLS
ncbi:MAG: hypothetical protein N3D85_04215 [Candidatus Bathyarchaeota archaeon]|nr:hypothetical protein [Candidatus Bathyarchaeota archaeon]